MSEEKNISITSNNQMGGVTAHTVNFGPKARSVNEQLCQQLKASIPTSAKITVIAVLGDGEAFGFAKQMLQWLKGNGYAKADGVTQAMYVQPVMGQNIKKKSDDAYELIIGTRQA